MLKVGAPGHVVIGEADGERALGPGEIRIKGLMSAISHGTELNLVRGTSPFAGKKFDADLRVFVPGEALDGHSPDRLGYEMAGIVTEVGPDVAEVKVGDLVHTGTPHQDVTIVDLPQQREFGYPVTRLPDGATLDASLFISLGSVAFQAIHDARIKIGDRVLVSGLGVIGLLTAQLARLNGASEVVVSDPIAYRRELAIQQGATLAIDPIAAAETGGVGLAVKQAFGPVGVDVAIETSGSYHALHAALASVGVGGRVVGVGFYQGDGKGLRLGEEWHHNRPDMISSMGVWGCPHRDYPLWDRQRLTDQVRDLLYSGKLKTSGMLTQIFAFEDAQQGYTLVDKHPEEVLKVALVFPAYEEWQSALPETR